MFLRSVVFLLLVSGVVVSNATAAIIVTLDNIALNAGGAGTLDVKVTGAPANVDLLDFFIGTFRITAIGGALAGGVTFDDPQVNPYNSDADYVFLNNFGPIRTVTQSVHLNDTLTTVDGTADFLGVDVNPQEYLLARLELSAAPGLAGFSQYQVSLVASESQFQTEAFDDISFSSSGGLITITGLPVAVPEPASCMALGLLATALTFFRTRKYCLH